ncbi:MAG: hypothetical protein WCC36_08790 [Gammaproteobacteria bacterium]
MDTIIVVYQTAPAPPVQEGKFLQLRLQGREYLVFAPFALFRYHNQLLARFLADRNLPHRWATPQRLVVDAADLDVYGGGRFRADAASGILRLWDNSQAYGRFREPGLAERIAAAGHRWSGFRVVIG